MTLEPWMTLNGHCALYFKILFFCVRGNSSHTIEYTATDHSVILAQRPAYTQRSNVMHQWYECHEALVNGL